jgi:hypothetical protein
LIFDTHQRSLLYVKRQPKAPTTSATDVTGDFGEFTSFMKRLVAVPRSELNSKLKAYEKAKGKRKAKKASASPGPASTSSEA